MVNARDGLNQTLDPAQARAMLDWLIDAGADEALSETPIDRFAVAAEPVAADEIGKLRYDARVWFARRCG